MSDDKKYAEIDAKVLSELDRADSYPTCIAEIDPKREAHEPIDICLLDGTPVVRLSPRFAHLAHELAEAVGLVVKRRSESEAA